MLADNEAAALHPPAVPLHADGSGRTNHPGEHRIAALSAAARSEIEQRMERAGAKGRSGDGHHLRRVRPSLHRTRSTSSGSSSASFAPTMTFSTARCTTSPTTTTGASDEIMQLTRDKRPEVHRGARGRDRGAQRWRLRDTSIAYSPTGPSPSGIGPGFVRCSGWRPRPELEPNS